MGGSSVDLLSKSVATSALSLRFYLFWLIFWFFFFYWLHISFTPSPYALIFSEDKWTGGLAPTESQGGRLPLTVGRTHLPAAALVVSNLDLTLALQRERERQRETERRQIGRSPLTISSNEENHGVASITPATSAAQSLNDKDDFYILPEDVPPEEAFDSSPKPRRYVIDLVLVLGSGRSGTSASSRSLQVFDFWVPNTVKASRDNPKGYFEDTEMIAFNDKVLKYLRYKYIGRETQTGSVPNTPQKFSERPYILEALGILQRNLAVGLQQRNRSESSEEDLCLPNDGYSRRKQKEEGANFDDCVIGRIGLKDPRMTRLLPFWRYIIDLFQHNFLSCNSSSDIPCVVLRPRFVLSIRNPAAYYESLLRASPSMAAMPESVLYHWLISYVIALYDTKPSERFLLHYGELTSKTSLIVNNLSKFFHIPLTTRIQDKRQQFAKEFIDESLNHHKNSTDDVRYLEKKYSVSGLAALYRALTGGEEQLRKLHLDQQPFDVNRLLLDFSDIQTDVLIEDTVLLKEKDKWQDSLHNFLNEWQEQKDDKQIDQNKEEDSAMKMETETQ